VREHEEVVGDELEALFRRSPKYRRAFRGQISRALYSFKRNRGLDLVADE
jgi:hypothetical protein